MVSRKWAHYIGLGLIFISLVILGSIFYPVIFEEAKYFLKQRHLFSRLYIDESTISKSQEFKIVIPKVDINSKVIPNVNPYNKEEYLKALKEGVALAKDTAFPNEEGNAFIFAHSTDSPLNVTKYNATFYLINKLEADDEIFLFYQGKKYKYVVTETKIVDTNQVEYLKDKTKKQTLTLMTCWPPGTTLQRLLVIGKLVILQ